MTRGYFGVAVYRVSTPLLDRLMPRLVAGPNGCLIWTGATDKRGYGVIARGRRDEGNVPVHVAAWEAENGPVPEGHVLDHTCHSNDPSCLGGDNDIHRRCANRTHLEPVTNQVNVDRGRGRGPTHHNARRTECKYGHPLDGVCKRGRYCKTCSSNPGRRARKAVKAKESVR